jgi:ATP/maltotriose-dependent transcriptional regulator MalT/DNA-binding SARP family transcriptional activator
MPGPNGLRARDRLRIVDSSPEPSVSFAPPDPLVIGPQGRTRATRAPVAVGPGRAVIATSARVRVDAEDGVSGYPIQPGKVQTPALRDETLARTRLLDWLEVKIHSRVVFVIADAGYGKTTLLADFSRRTRLRTLWYRIDEEDRDWVGFLSHLVAAGREHDPGFAPSTSALLRSLEPGGTTREDAIETFLAELPSIASDGAVLVFDDFHLADEVSDIRLIAREIVTRAPERLSIVFASRRQPAVPVARLRSLGELAEIGIAELRFSESEMEQLFRETFRRPLEADVLAELARRTEGWAASLSLVQAALRERSPAETRSFVRGLSGAHDELHDYLAEEVVGDLPAIHQQYLMRPSILQLVTAELAQVATGLAAIEVQSLLTESERLGLLGRRTERRASGQRYDPLVREFLESRLVRDIGRDAVNELHSEIARWAEPYDWQTAAYHYVACRRWVDLQRVLEASLETIMAAGAFSIAAEYIEQMPDGLPLSATVEVVRSRLASLVGDIEQVMAHAKRAVEIDPGSDVVVNNLIASSYLSGELDVALGLADHLAVQARSPLMRSVGQAASVSIRTSVDYELTSAIRVMEDLAQRSRENGHPHFEGVSLLNASLMYRAQGATRHVLSASSQAIDALSSSSSGNELASATFIKAWGLAFQGDLQAARQLMRGIGADLRNSSRAEFLVEHAELEAQFGDAGLALHLLSETEGLRVPGSVEAVARLVRTQLRIRDHDFKGATLELANAPTTRPTSIPGHSNHILAMTAVVAALNHAPQAKSLALVATASADRQHAHLWRALATLSNAAGTGQIGPALIELPQNLRGVISLACELVLDRLDALSEAAMDVVTEEAASRPERWRPAIRRAVSEGTERSRLVAARLLDIVGDQSDVVRLRAFAREPGRVGIDRMLGRTLARRLAPRAIVEDLGRVTIRLGSVEIGGGEVRRKVLATLCFLLTKPRFAAAREEVMDAMWPDMDPTAALNSLNQTLYFLRRVFEPAYSEDTSAGYVHQESDIVWLDPVLVQSRSAMSAELVAEYANAPSPEGVRRLSDTYVGRFALDFAYEDWANDFRESLHVGYLHVIESSIREDIQTGHFERGIEIARRALELDPGLDTLELSLLRLLKNAGAHSAAAEQYGRYAHLLREELGVDPPPFETI